MKTIVLLILASFSMASTAISGFEAGVTIGEEGVKGFYLSVGDYYNVPEREIIIIREKRIPDEELPVVFFLSEKAGVHSSKIMDLRLKGKTWLEITIAFGLSPEVFYIETRKGPPYGKAYGYYFNKPKKEWKKLSLADADIITLVNVSFISVYYGISPDEVIEMRGKGNNFVSINDNVRKAKGKKEGHGKGKGEKGQKKKKN